MKDYIKLLIDVVFGDSLYCDEYSGFLDLNDSILDMIPHWRIIGRFDEGDENEQNMKNIIDNIKTRNIYKCFGDIITDSKIEVDNYDKDNIIIDTIKLSFYGKDKCKYMKHRSIDKTISIKNNDKYITSIYYKSSEYKLEAGKIFDALI